MNTISFLFALMTYSLLLGVPFTYADQFEINPDSLHTQTKQVPHTSPISITPPIVIKPNILERSTPSSLFLKISPDVLNFDALNPTDPLLRDTTISIQGIPSSLYVYMLHPLRTFDNKVIPLTTCDSGICTSTVSDTWTNNLTFGFGYRQFGQTSFLQPSIYLSNGNDLIQNNSSDNTGIHLVYKINTSGSQPRGSYVTTIEYVAIPNL